MKKLILCLFAVMAMVACAPKETKPQVGTVIYDTINNVPCRVYLPHNYVEGGKCKVESGKYPVLYLQHGMWGNEHDWTEQGHLLHWMDSLLQLGQVREMVIIMPDNCPHRETSEEERANAMSGEWIRHFADFMAETERKYNVSDDPSLRAIAGLSMGGFHSMHISHYLHGQFAYVGLFSPAIRHPHPDPAYDNWEEEVRLQMQESPVYWIAIGNEDFLYDNVQEYRQWLEANHIEYTYYESAGGHVWPNWEDYICRFLKILFKRP